MFRLGCPVLCGQGQVGTEPRGEDSLGRASIIKTKQQQT